MTKPKRRRCAKYSHHQWGEPTGPTGTGWRIVTCLMCGRTELE